MSYARVGEGHSDVYVYSDGELLHCMADNKPFTCPTPQEMIDHLMTHRRRGQKVPQRALDRLAAERDGIPYETDVERGIRALREAGLLRDDDYTPEAIDRDMESE